MQRRAGPPGIQDLSPQLQRRQDRRPEDEILYFFLPDRFALDPKQARPLNPVGYDPKKPDFYNGGTLRGARQRLDYLRQLGVTAIWIGPVFKNMPIKGDMAGYHGYWITDFTDIDPHLGTKSDFAALVRAAHARRMKVYLDIVINHTADVISYADCPQTPCPYRPLGQRPYRPKVARSQAHLKVPAWLNDPRHYHNRGDTDFTGESSLYGDFAGLDDLKTEDRAVIRGFIKIYGDWIKTYHLDGFRIDTARHVNPEFWQAFLPAMARTAKRAKIPPFHIFGEVADKDPRILSRFTRKDGFQSVLDFGFADAIRQVVSQDHPPRVLADLYAKDRLYAKGQATARTLPTFLGNHDMGRFGGFLFTDHPGLSSQDALKRDQLAHSLMFLLRGIPTLYAGDEQGMAGQGDYGLSRESLFASKVPAYRQERRIGTQNDLSLDAYDTTHPLFTHIQTLAHLRTALPALRRGDQVVLMAEDRPGLLVVKRTHGKQSLLIAFNTATEARTYSTSPHELGGQIKPMMGPCQAGQAQADGQIVIEVPPLDYWICTVSP